MRGEDSPQNLDMQEINDTYNPNAAPGAVPFPRNSIDGPNPFGYGPFENPDESINTRNPMSGSMRN